MLLLLSEQELWRPKNLVGRPFHLKYGLLLSLTINWIASYLCKNLFSKDNGSKIAKYCDLGSYFTLYCRNTRILDWNKTFWDRQPSTSLSDCLTTLPLFVFTWWEDFLKISRQCLGWEVEGFSFRLNGWQQYCVRNYEKNCKAPKWLIYEPVLTLSSLSYLFEKWQLIGKLTTQKSSKFGL